MKITEKDVDNKDIFILDLSKITDESQKQRKIISRILSVGNFIAIKYGPAHYAEIPDLDLLKDYLEDGYLAGIKIVENKELESTIIVGRNTKEKYIAVIENELETSIDVVKNTDQNDITLEFKII